MPAAAIVGGAVIGGAAQVISGNKAAKAQTKASNAAITNEQQQFQQIRELLAPYVMAGDKATDAQLSLIGLFGDEAQRTAIESVRSGPEFEALTRQGENAILQNASATGGLRGGNTQDALSRFRPELLSQLLNERFGKLGDIAARGQASAAGQANLQAGSAANVSNLLGQIGSANAGRALATGQAIGGIGSAVSTLGTLGLLKQNPGLTKSF